jgi:hypothetical protein
MAPTEKRKPWLYSGAEPEIVYVALASAQTFDEGTPAVIKSSGYAIAAPSFTSSAANALHGFFLADADAPAKGTKVRMAKVTNSQVWAMYLSNAGSDTVASQALVGDIYGLTVLTTTAPRIGYATCDVGINPTATFGGLIVVDILANQESSKNTTSDDPGVALVKVTQVCIDASTA